MRRNILDITISISQFQSPVGYENLSREEIMRRAELTNQIITDRLGVTTNIDLGTSDDASLNSAENISRAHEVIADISNTAERIHGRIDPIINSREFVEWLIRQMIKLQEFPFAGKLIIITGFTITIVGGGYLAYKLVRRSNPSTPFGPKLTIFGRIMKAIMYKD